MAQEDAPKYNHATEAEVSNLITLMQKKMKITDIHMQMYLLEHTASLARKISFYYTREDE